MVGAQADLYNLSRVNNSLGLVKNFRLQTEPGFVDLTQGRQNTTVFSFNNSNKANGSAEVFEYTPRNLAYMAQVNGILATPSAAHVTYLTTAIVAPAATFQVVTTTGLIPGDWVLIADLAYPDDAVVRRVSTAAAGTITPTVPIDRNFPNGSVVKRVNFTPIASKSDAPYYSAVVTGRLADNSDLAVLLPKIKIKSGLNLGFTTNEYGSLPFAFDIYDLVPSDPFYATFASMPAMLMTEAYAPSSGEPDVPVGYSLLLGPDGNNLLGSDNSYLYSVS